MTPMELLAQADALDASANRLDDPADLGDERRTVAQTFRDRAVRLREQAFAQLLTEEKPKEEV